MKQCECIGDHYRGVSIMFFSIGHRGDMLSQVTSVLSLQLESDSRSQH